MINVRKTAERSTRSRRPIAACGSGRSRSALSLWVLAAWIIGPGSLWGQDSAAAEPQPPSLRIGVTLHAYYSWVAKVGGDDVEVVPVLPAGSDPHVYQPRPDDLDALRSLDAIVVNGLGHDSFIPAMLRAADRSDLLQLRLADGVAARATSLVAAESQGEAAQPPNSHVFLSITGATHQIHNLARALGELDPPRRGAYRERARRYVRELRDLQARMLSAMSDLETTDLRVATVHDGYSYLLQEIGLPIAAIVQPRHGVAPTPRQLSDTLRRLQNANVHVLFTEADYPSKLVQVIREGSGVRVHRLTHGARGAYTVDKFAEDIAYNYRSIISALQGYTERRRGG